MGTKPFFLSFTSALPFRRKLSSIPALLNLRKNWNDDIKGELKRLSALESMKIGGKRSVKGGKVKNQTSRVECGRYRSQSPSLSRHPFPGRKCARSGRRVSRRRENPALSMQRQSKGSDRAGTRPSARSLFVGTLQGFSSYPTLGSGFDSSLRSILFLVTKEKD